MAAETMRLSTYSERAVDLGGHGEGAGYVGRHGEKAAEPGGHGVLYLRHGGRALDTYLPIWQRRTRRQTESEKECLCCWSTYIETVQITALNRTLLQSMH